MRMMTNFIGRIRTSHKKGFTLTEVLLAVMIVGLIAVALASLTRAAARESGVGRSKIMLRNNLSMFLRTLRKDISTASRIDYIAGTLGSVGTTAVPVLKLSQNLDSAGNKIIFSYTDDSANVLSSGKRITYCFKRGTDNANIKPSGAYRGGKIYRIEKELTALTTDKSYPECTSLSDTNLALDNVKYINDSTYPVPLFAAHSLSREMTKSLVTVRLIAEINSKPIVNDVVEEVFAMPTGGY